MKFKKHLQNTLPQPLFSPTSAISIINQRPATSYLKKKIYDGNKLELELEKLQ